MGLHEIRTALKVDLQKPAADQPGLHVGSVRLLHFYKAWIELEAE